MVTTRSKAMQTHLEDYAEDRPAKSRSAPKKKSASSKTAARQNPPSSSPPRRKRKVSPIVEKKPSPKKIKVEESDPGDEPVIINRAPVLHLWSACVAHFLYPDLDWSTCLSAGSAISAMTAVAKGRSIGTIDQPEDTEERRQKKTEQKKGHADDDILEVMQFKLQVQKKKVLFSGKPQSDREDTFSNKFGDRYGDVKTVFEDALRSWEGSEDELRKQGFHMYEKFRPTVPKGQKGWGRKGELNLKLAREAILKK